ncbi:hypothetical protein LUZ60_013158 [Juncus effusus]|nr:hypothetical protein LUZ60_013158 [Juncus effusus]
MVSLRRKNTKSFVGEQRRSARLVALEQGNGISTDQRRRKGKNIIEENEGPYYAPETGESSNSKSVSNRSTDQIIENVLDVLELKDTHELFTMPDSMQIEDYIERVKNPTDFATLRQKNIDGMYKTLEQFESDVYMVFKKAMTINGRNTIPYKQAICLQDQAKQVFQSLKNNRTHSELELSAWHQKYVRGRKRARTNDKNAPASSSNQTRPNAVKTNSHSDIETENSKANVEETEVNQSSNVTKTYTRNIRSRSSQIVRTKRDNFGYSKARLEEPRSTYITENETASNFAHQSQSLVFNPFSPRYQESLRLFVKNAGKEAQKAAELKFQEVTQRTKNSNFTKMPFFFPQIGANSSSSTFNTTRPANFFPPNLYNAPFCKLETDDLLKWFSLIGTPEFLEYGKAGTDSNSDKMVAKSQYKDKQPIMDQLQITQFLNKGSAVLKPKEMDNSSIQVLRNQNL